MIPASGFESLSHRQLVAEALEATPCLSQYTLRQLVAEAALEATPCHPIRAETVDSERVFTRQPDHYFTSLLDCA